MAATEVMTVEFYDDDLIGDEFLGSLSFDIGEELRKLPLDCRNAEWHQAFPLDKVTPAFLSTNALFPRAHAVTSVQHSNIVGMAQ